MKRFSFVSINSNHAVTTCPPLLSVTVALKLTLSFLLLSLPSLFAFAPSSSSPSSSSSFFTSSSSHGLSLQLVALDHQYHAGSFSSSFAERMHKGFQDEQRIRTVSTTSTSSSTSSSTALFSTTKSSNSCLSGLFRSTRTVGVRAAAGAVRARLGKLLRGTIGMATVLGCFIPGVAKASTMVGVAAATAASTTTAVSVSTTSSAAVSLSTLAWQILIACAIVLPSCGSILMAGLTRTLQLSFVWYMRQLTSNPMITKSITAAVIGVTGDYMAQGIERMLLHKSTSSSTSSSTHSSTHPPRHHYDARRGLSIIPHSLFISGPLMHFAYDLFEKFLPVSTGAGPSRGLAAISHVLADSVFLDSVFVATTFVVTGLMEGYNKRQLASQLQKDYVPTLMASWVTSLGLLPLEFLCFRFLPVSLRVMAVNVIDVIWDTVISFMAHRSRSGNNAQQPQPQQQQHNEDNDPQQLHQQPKIEYHHHHHHHPQDYYPVPVVVEYHHQHDYHASEQHPQQTLETPTTQTTTTANVKAFEYEY